MTTTAELKLRRRLRGHLRQLDRIEEQTGWYLQWFKGKEERDGKGVVAFQRAGR